MEKNKQNVRQNDEENHLASIQHKKLQNHEEDHIANDEQNEEG